MTVCRANTSTRSVLCLSGLGLGLCQLSAKGEFKRLLCEGSGTSAYSGQLQGQSGRDRSLNCSARTHVKPPGKVRIPRAAGLVLLFLCETAVKK